MHRLIRSRAVLLPLAGVLALGCGGSKKPAELAASDADGGGGAETPSEGASEGDGGAADKKDECVGFDIGNLEELLLKSGCEEPGQKPDSVAPVDLKGKLEVTLGASPTRPAPGAKVDLLVTFANRSKEPLVLHFRLDPVPRFEVEAYDTKKAGKRADLPGGKPPPPPKGASPPPASEPKSARITLAPNGSARARVPWEAVKTRWAPEKYRGSLPERGYPRSAAGPLPKGKYTVKVVSPLVGVSEGIDHETSAPRVELDIGG
jgi:hypothetical protein